MRLQKQRVKKAIALLQEVGVELTADMKQKALAGHAVVDEHDIKCFKEMCQEACVSGEPFVVNFNHRSDHPVFHPYGVFRRLRRHIMLIRGLRGKKKRVFRLKFHKSKKVRIKINRKPVDTK